MELLVTYHLKNDRPAEFLSAIADIGIPELVRLERGCLRYEYYVPADGGSTLILLEKWENAELQALHLEQPHMQRLAAIKPNYVSSTEVQVILR